MSGFDAFAGGPGSLASAGAVYHDPHETSLPLLLLGVVITVPMVLQTLGWGRPPVGLLSDWGVAVLLTTAFAVIWLTFRRRAAARGLRPAPGFGLAATIGLMAILLFFVVLFYAGPFILFGIGLVAAGIRLGNRFLAGWGVVVGGIGVFEGFFGITNRLPFSLWAGWEHPAIYLSLGLATVVAGVIVRRRENGAAG